MSGQDQQPDGRSQGGAGLGPDDRPPQGSHSSSTTDLLLMLVAVLAVGGGVAWWYVSHRASPPPPPAPAAVAPAEPAPAPPVTATAPTPAPTPDQAALLEAVSADARLRKLLAGDDLADRAAAALANLAAGGVPHKLLEPLAPARPFAVLEKDGRTVIDPASYHRYDALATAVHAVDARAAATAWKALHPALEVAWRALGEPEPSVDRALARALSRLETAPVEAGDVAVEPPPDAKGAMWHYADPTLESRAGVEKQLLRLGPANARVVKGKAAELRKALGLELVKAGR